MRDRPERRRALAPLRARLPNAPGVELAIAADTDEVTRIRLDKLMDGIVSRITSMCSISPRPPANGVKVRLEQRSADGWLKIAERATNDDGRAADLTAEGSLQAGHYRLTSETASISARQRDHFHPEVVMFEIATPSSTTTSPAAEPVRLLDVPRQPRSARTLSLH